MESKQAMGVTELEAVQRAPARVYEKEFKR